MFLTAINIIASVTQRIIENNQLLAHLKNGYEDSVRDYLKLGLHEET